MPEEYVDATAAVTAARRHGPFFDLGTDARGPHWRPLRDLTTDPSLVARRVDRATRQLGPGARDQHPRVVASTVFLGLAAGLVSAPLAAAVEHGVVLLLDPDRLYVAEADAGPWPLALPDPVGTLATTPAHAAELLDAVLLEHVVAPLVDRQRRDYHLSARVLWGDVASAVATAAAILAQADPARGDTARTVVHALLRRGRLTGTGSLATRWRRRSCCLAYRIDPLRLCGDCVLTG